MLPLAHNFPTLTLIATMALLCVVVGASLWLWRFDRSMRDVVRSARELARGNLSATVNARGPLHLTALSDALNVMAVQLEDRLSAVVEQRNTTGAILSSMVEGVLALDLDERIISINRAGTEMLRVVPEQIVGRSIQESIRNTTLHSLVGQTLELGGATQGETTLRGRHESEADRYVQVQTAPLKDSHGHRLGVLMVLHDVTELRRLESVRRDFVANVSHEVKTPVAAVKAAVETMLDNPEMHGPQAEWCLKIVQRQAGRLEAIVEDLLTLARIEQQQGELLAEIEAQPLAPLVFAALQTCQSKADERLIKIVNRVPAYLTAQVNGPLLEQALINLIDNAVKYSEPKTTVTLDGLREGDEVVLAVRDQGRGIEPQHLTRVFERFYRTDRARSREMGGTGLGLAIVKHAAETLHGRVSVDSRPGHGSVFRIHLIPAVDLPALPTGTSGTSGTPTSEGAVGHRIP